MQCAPAHTQAFFRAPFNVHYIRLPGWHSMFVKNTTDPDDAFIPLPRRKMLLTKGNNNSLQDRWWVQSFRPSILLANITVYPVKDHSDPGTHPRKHKARDSLDRMLAHSKAAFSSPAPHFQSPWMIYSSNPGLHVSKNLPDHTPRCSPYITQDSRSLLDMCKRRIGVLACSATFRPNKTLLNNTRQCKTI